MAGQVVELSINELLEQHQALLQRAAFLRALSDKKDATIVELTASLEEMKVRLVASGNESETP